MKKGLLAGIVVICFGLISCATMGSANTDNSLLLLVNENETMERGNAFGYYQFKGENVTLKIDVMQKYQQINYYKPGVYAIKNFECIYIKDDSIANTSSCPIKFELQKDTVFVFPYKTVTTMTAKGQSIRLLPLTEADKKKCEDFIKTQKRYTGLAVKF